MTTAQCLICNELVEEAAQASHLAAAHPAPAGGFRFYVDEKPYFTDKPSMLVADVKKAHGEPEWPLFEERNGERYHFADAEAVDLTREPRFYIDLPATSDGAPR